jgi:DNA-directed RNA polymerase specialized sigma24 family protein
MEAKKAKNPVSGNLKPMEVLAVLAYHAYELTAPEVAAWLNMPRSTTQEYIRKGTEKLRTRGLPDA